MQDNEEKDIHMQLKQAAVFLTEYAATLMAVGAQTSRIVINTQRIAVAWGFNASLLIFTKTLSITLTDSHSRHTFTYVGKTPALPLNFNTNMRLSQLSWRVHDKSLTLAEMKRHFSDIVTMRRESPLTVLLLAACANACFCRLFDGNLTSMAIVWVATLAGFFIRQQLIRLKMNIFGVFTVCSFISTMIGCTDYLFFHGGTEDMSLATSMLYLVPGVPIINGVMDIIDRHELNGIARLTHALLLVVCIALGLTATIMITHVSPFNFTRVVRPDVLQAAIIDGLFAAIAGLGFAIISNPPRKALAVCALLACVGHGIRYFLMHHHSIMMDQASASTIAGVAIGLLSILFARRIQCPAECFAFPALLPMVPGMFAYKAVRDIINIVQLPEAYTSKYVALFFHNSTLVVLVMMGMVVGCVTPIFIFHRQSFSVTRDR